MATCAVQGAIETKAHLSKARSRSQASEGLNSRTDFQPDRHYEFEKGNDDDDDDAYDDDEQE